MARIVQPLTNTQVEKAKHTQGGTNELNDGNGLFLQLFPTGLKSWRFRYNHPATGKRTKLTIGAYPEISLAQARAKREDFRAWLAQGIDPQSELEQQAIAKSQSLNRTFLAVAEQWKEKRSKEVEPLTMHKNWERLHNHLFPLVGSYPIEQITSPLLIQAVKPLDEKGHNDTLHRILNLANQILNYAVTVGVLEFNRCTKASDAYHKAPQKHHPAVHYSELPKLIADFDSSTCEPLTKALFKWELLSMVRPAEAVSVEWSEIDFDKALWYIPAEKMKKARNGALAHTVPLSTQMLAILQALKPITGDRRFVFPSFTSPNKSMSKETVASALREMGYQGEQSAHGLRSIGKTYLEDKLIDFRLIESSLSHRVGNKVNQAYNRTDYLEARRPIMQLWGDYVEQCSNA